MTRPSIWCLFSVDNLYDQPDNNLVRFWHAKPSIETLAKFLAAPLGTASDEAIVRVVSIWAGKTETATGTTYYRLQEVQEGKSP